MPIRKENRGLYPENWRELAREIKEANHYECMDCGLKCRRPGEAFDTMRRTLTVAHLNSIYESPWVLLVPLCCPCHLKHDARAAWVARRRNLRRRQFRAGQLEMRLQARLL